MHGCIAIVDLGFFCCYFTLYLVLVPVQVCIPSLDGRLNDAAWLREGGRHLQAGICNLHVFGTKLVFMAPWHQYK